MILCLVGSIKSLQTDIKGVEQLIGICFLAATAAGVSI